MKRRANEAKNAIRTLVATLATTLAMTTFSIALQTSIPAAQSWTSKRSLFSTGEGPHATKSPKAHEFAKATVHFVLVSIPDRKLALLKNGRLVRTYRIAVGKASTPSPTGAFKIVNRVSNPTYYHKGQVIAAGKGNPVGTRWMGLSAKGYGIHGTNQPNSIGKAASTGCIRMGKRDLEELFELVNVGDAVEIRSERDEQIAQIFPAEAETEMIAEAGGEAGAEASRGIGQVGTVVGQ